MNDTEKQVILYTIENLKILQIYNSIEEACKNLEVSFDDFMTWRIDRIPPKGFEGFDVSCKISYNVLLINRNL